jgi:hypothetical protein
MTGSHAGRTRLFATLAEGLKRVFAAPVPATQKEQSRPRHDLKLSRRSARQLFPIKKCVAIDYDRARV